MMCCFEGVVGLYNLWTTYPEAARDIHQPCLISLDMLQ